MANGTPFSRFADDLPQSRDTGQGGQTTPEGYVLPSGRITQDIEEAREAARGPVPLRRTRKRKTRKETTTAPFVEEFGETELPVSEEPFARETVRRVERRTPEQAQQEMRKEIELEAQRQAIRERERVLGPSELVPSDLKRPQGPVRSFFTGLAEGFTFQMDPEVQADPTQRARSFGQVFGTVGGIATFGPKAEAQATRAGQAVVKATPDKLIKVAEKIRKSKAIQTVESSRALRFARDIGVAQAESLAITAAGEKAILETLTPEEKAIAQSPEFKRQFGDIIQEQERKAREKGIKSAVISELSLLTLPKEEFEQLGRERGLTSQEIDTALKIRKQRGITEIAQNLNIARFSEGVGRREVSKAFQKAAEKGVKVPQRQAFSTVFKMSAPGIARAGAIEGFTQEIAQQRERQKDLDLKAAAIMGGIGAGSAGLLGGFIAGTAVTKPGVSKVTETVASIVDPFEKPGDILEDITQATAKRLGRRTMPTPTVRVTGVTETFQFGATPQRGKVPKPKKAPKSRRPVKVPSLAIVSPVSIPEAIQQQQTGRRGDILSPIPVEPRPPITPTAPSRTQTPADIFSPSEQIQTTINVATPAPVFTPVPVVTPLPRIPPPPPISPSTGAGSGAGARKGRRVFRQELKEGLKLLNRIL